MKEASYDSKDEGSDEAASQPDLTRGSGASIVPWSFLAWAFAFPAYS